MTIRRIAVVVPAHNESRLLPACLTALHHAIARSPVPVLTVVVADDCTDGTARLALAGHAEVIVVEERNVGRARAAGVAHALRDGPDDLWLASTDADSRVPPNWLLRQLRHAEHGADLVTGTVEVDDWSAWPDPLPSAYERRYRESVAGARHGHIHGANLGVRATTYLAAGGFPALTCDEDRTLVTRVRATGARVITDARDPVRTSARPDGRAPHGFAAHLLTLSAES
ncbi:glycosyltransferase [Actinoplanes awajinensis]|uniref:glycosyltransferase n=1 Tax=Actinoplanes awajinensis TaxID=135946 RepID=UPI00082FA011|nr:glycosyltransferase family 2 protein [Actinoplanes awajinensis]